MPSSPKAVAKFAVGDLVQSKAGGPKMVVDQIHIPRGGGALAEMTSAYDDGDLLAEEKAPSSPVKYWCIWFVGAKRHREQFSEGSLTEWVEPTK